MPQYDPNRHRDIRQVTPVPLEYAGQWVVWSADRCRIVAHGATLDEVARSVGPGEHPQVLFAKVPKLGVFIGNQRAA